MAELFPDMNSDGSFKPDPSATLRRAMTTFSANPLTNPPAIEQDQGSESLAISDAVPRLPDYALPGTYNTTLEAPVEQEFQQWVKQNNVPFDIKAPVSDYDMRGFYQALKTGDPKAQSAIDPNDGKMHYPDYWKTPYHPTFSAESQWADSKKAPRWNSKDQLVMPDGRVVYDDRKANMKKKMDAIESKIKPFLEMKKKLQNAK